MDKEEFNEKQIDALDKAVVSASILRSVKWNMGRISRFPLLTLNAFSTTCKMAGRRQTIVC